MVWVLGINPVDALLGVLGCLFFGALGYGMFWLIRREWRKSKP